MFFAYVLLALTIPILISLTPPKGTYPYALKSKETHCLSNLAVFSCNFGKFRNETERGLDSLAAAHFASSGAEMHFFTDDFTLKSKSWKIHTDIICDVACASKNENRMLSKYCKFGLDPSTVTRRPYILWADSSVMLETERSALGVHRSWAVWPSVSTLLTRCSPYIARIIKDHPSHRLWMRKNTDTSSAECERNATVKDGRENPENLRHFLSVENYSNSDLSVHPEMNFWIRRTHDPELVTALGTVFSLLCTYGLNRDQNIFGPVISRVIPAEQIFGDLKFHNHEFLYGLSCMAQILLLVLAVVLLAKAMI